MGAAAATTSISPSLADLLTTDVLGHVATVRDVGRPYSWRGRPREIFELTIDHVSASEGCR